jgi:hypothetical protein
MISRLTHRQQFYTLAVRAALQHAVIELRQIGEAFRQPQAHDQQQESRRKSGEAAGEAVIFFPPPTIATILPRGWRPYRADGSECRQGQGGTEGEYQRFTPPKRDGMPEPARLLLDIGYMPENPGASPLKPSAASLVGAARMLR